MKKEKRFGEGLWMLIFWTAVIMVITAITHTALANKATWIELIGLMAMPFAVAISGVWLAICSYSITNAITTRFQRSEGGKIISFLVGICLIGVTIFLITRIDEALFCWTNGRLLLGFSITLGVAISGVTISHREPKQILPDWFWQDNGLEDTWDTRPGQEGY